MQGRTRGVTVQIRLLGSTVQIRLLGSTVQIRLLGAVVRSGNSMLVALDPEKLLVDFGRAGDIETYMADRYICMTDRYICAVQATVTPTWLRPGVARTRWRRRPS